MRLTILMALLLATGTGAFAQAPYKQVQKKAAAVAAPAAGSELEEKLQAKLGKPLSADQKQKMKQAQQLYNAALRTPHAKFIQDAARTLGQTVDVVGALVPFGSLDGEGLESGVIPKLEGKLARKLKPNETNALKQLNQGRKSAVKAAQDNYARQLAAITGVPATSVAEMLPK